MLALAGAPATAAKPAAAADPGGIVTIEHALATEFRNALARKRDQFASPSPIGVVPGFKFEILIDPADGTADGIPRQSCSYSYSSGHLRFECRVRDVVEAPGEVSADYVDGFIFEGQQLARPGHVGRGRAGVGRHPAFEAWLHFAIRSTSRPAAEPSPDAPGLEDTTYFVDVAATPERARQLAKSTVFVVRGEVAAQDGHELAECASNALDPTIDDWTCSISARVDLVAFVDPVTKSVLKVWPAAGPPALHPPRL